MKFTKGKQSAHGRTVVFVFILLLSTSLAFFVGRAYAVGATGVGWVINNGNSIQWKDSGGTARDEIWLDSANNLNFGGSGTSQIVLGSDLNLNSRSIFGTATFANTVVLNFGGTLNLGTTAVIFNGNNIPAAGVTGIGADGNAGNFIINVPTGKNLEYFVNGVEQTYFDTNGNLAFLKGGNLPNTVPFIAADGGADLTLNAPSAKLITFTINGANVIWIGATGVTRFLNIPTAGLGVPAIYCSYNTAGLSSLVTNACNYTPPSTAGVYDACVSVNVHTAAAVNMAVTLGYKDAGGNVQSYSMQLQQQGSTTVVNNINNPAANTVFSDCELFSINNGGTAITVSTTGTTQTSYDLSVTLEQVA